MKTPRSFGVAAGLSAIQTLAARILIAAVGIVTGVIVARWLGPGGKGVYSGIQTLLAVPIAICSGGGAAITYVLTKQRRSVAELFPALFAIFSLLCLASLCAVAAYALIRGWTMEGAALALALPPSIVLSWQPSYYVALGRVGRLNAQQLVFAAFLLIATAAGVIWLHAGVWGAVAAWLIALYAFASIVVWDAVQAGGRLHTLELRSRIAELSRVGGQSALNAGLGLLNYRIDSLVLIAMLGLPVFGIYSIAVSAGEMLFLISRAANTAIGREVGISDAKRSAEITAYTIRAGFAVCVAAAIPVALFAPPLVHIVYGSRFDPAALPLRMLLPGIVAFASAGTFASFFIFQLGRPAIVTAVNIVMIAAQMLACIVLVPRYGLAGAAFSSSVTYVIGALISTIVFWRLTGVSPRRVWLISRSDLASLRNILLHRKRERAASADSRRHVVVTGAAGNVARLVREQLAARHELMLTDIEPVRDLRRHERFMRTDLGNMRDLRRMMRGAKAVVHLGGISKEAPFERLMRANMRGTYAVLEAARLEGVPHVIIASSGHVTGFYSRAEIVDESAPLRPDSLYAVSKCFAESLAHFYSDKYGMNVLCIRIGHVSAAPEFAIDESIWLRPDDLVQLIELALGAPPGFHVVYGASENAMLFWSLERAKSLGYKPSAGATPADCPAAGPQSLVAQIVQGESFAGDGFSGSLERLSMELYRAKSRRA